jgi:hypothetical protein
MKFVNIFVVFLAFAAISTRKNRRTRGGKFEDLVKGKSTDCNAYHEALKGGVIAQYLGSGVKKECNLNCENLDYEQRKNNYFGVANNYAAGDASKWISAVAESSFALNSNC